MVELVRGHGVRLPDDIDLTFGLSHDEVVERLRLWPGVQDTWVCRSAWAYAIELTGTVVTVYAGEDDRLGGVQVSRRLIAAGGGREGIPPVEPVLFAGVDLFSGPEQDILDGLAAHGLPLVVREQTVSVGESLMFFRLDAPGLGFAEVSLRARHTP